MTKKQLAERIGVDPRSISAFENAEFPPSEENLGKLERALGFPVAFFFGDDLDVPVENGVSFRAMSKMSARQRHAALSAGAIAFLLDDWIEGRFDLPNVDLLDLRDETPQAAAASLRQYWGIGERPIRNMVHLLEAKGVRVFSLTENCREVDAYSLWRGSRPFIFLNTYKSAEHSRFDAAHELGHLVLHKHAAPNGLEAEKEANTFASAFLMPAASVLSAAPVVPSLRHLIKLKARWTVSVAALAYRLHVLELLSDWHYRTLCIQVQQHGYRKNEPNEARRETSQVWDKVFSTLRAQGITKHDLAKDLSVPVREVERLVFGLVMIGISSTYQSFANGSGKRGSFHVVE